MDILLEPKLLAEIERRKKKVHLGLVQWGKQNFRPFPWRANRAPYAVLVSELLLKRTTATAVKRIFEQFISRYPNLQKLAHADRQQLESLLSRIGYHKRRATMLIEISAYILKKHDGKIPRKKQELLDIPFVGEYTANAILSLSYGIPTAMVDSNIQRIVSRLFCSLLPTRPSPKIVQKTAEMLAPNEDNQNYNYSLLDLGALVCKYGIPKCTSCPLNSQCDYYELNLDLSTESEAKT